MRSPLGNVQLHIVSGRLMLTSRQAVRGSRSSSSSSGKDRMERITVDMTGQHPAIEYQLTTSQSQLVINIRNQSQFRIARELRVSGSKDVPFEFKQDEGGDLSFVWGDGDLQRPRRFPTLWHLLLVEGKSAEAHLLPVLEFFRPGWNLAAAKDRISEALFANAQPARSPPARPLGAVGLSA